MAHGDRKTRRLRGSRMHGFGNTQKKRGGGSRGGHGMAGSKKHRWHLVSKYMPGYFGRKGFKRYRTQVVCDTTINVGQLSKSIDNFVSEGKATGSKGVYTIDLGVVGYTKLLGTGNVEVKLNVTVQKCSTSAKQKIEAAGGSIETAEKTSDSKKDKTAGD